MIKRKRPTKRVKLTIASFALVVPAPAILAAEIQIGFVDQDLGGAPMFAGDSDLVALKGGTTESYRVLMPGEVWVNGVWPLNYQACA